MGLIKEEKQRLAFFEKRLGYKFKKKEHLKRALTHKSWTNEQRLPPTENNERYEYLGDAVLELAMSSLLMERNPKHPEGELSKIRASIVNEQSLAVIAKGLKLGDYLYLGKGEDQTGGRDKPSLLSDALEAVFGAIYLDRGFDKAMKVIKKNYSEVFDGGTGGSAFMKDFKTRLQEVSQCKFRVVPRYRLISERGPDHQKLFEIHLYIKEEMWGIGKGLSKKAAEQEAAKETLAKLEARDEGRGTKDEK